MAEAAPSIRKSWKGGLSTQMAMHGRDKTLSPRRSAEFFLRNSVVVVAGVQMGGGCTIHTATLERCSINANGDAR